MIRGKKARYQAGRKRFLRGPGFAQQEQFIGALMTDSSGH